ncbi:PucR family transcriptional regulator [Streptomyces sp. TRM68416]|uniref:PucR family transcriptional regulator n=1 Tax=Streptomyces sp. TRM68416 TaxID=2758412 RepID=UPI001661FC90|nr:PucR family transcriptional regulator [Streptomyces sp. TRM68416]MBD0844605.1 PucR family transcriptional regulator [Streptomyces sp. TRM68416]
MSTAAAAPAPAAPPTPPVPLSALLAREDLALRQIAGPTGPAVVIHWAHASEMADPYPYLLGGELLLTAGVHIAGTEGSDASFDDYVSRIVAAGGAALGFGLAPVHEAVPPALVAACEAQGLPLLEVPPQTPFAGVARAVWQLMAQARHAELRRVTEAQQSLAAAASRPDPVPSVLRQLARRVGGRAVLFGPDGGLLAEAGRQQGDAVNAGRQRTDAVIAARQQTDAANTAHQQTNAANTARQQTDTANTAHHQTDAVSAGLAALARVVTGRSSATATDTVAGSHLAAYALAPGHGSGFVLAVAAPRRDPSDHTIASVAAVLLSLLTGSLLAGEQVSGTDAARSSALVRMLLGAAPHEVAPLLGTGAWHVVHAHPAARTAPDAVAASALGTALGSPLVDLADDVVRVLVPAEREPAPQPGWTLGVSDAAQPAQWPAADRQAARALARARATRAPLVRHRVRAALTDLVPRDEAEAHARTLLAPVADSPALVDTLRTWLSLHGSWDRTAVALSVHRNTVRQRIAKCAALLDTDLDDPDVRMELWFALRK